MKRFLCMILTFLMLFPLCGCSATNVKSNQSVTLTFVFGEHNISAVLTDEEAAEVIRILDGKKYDSLLSGVPACGFTKDVSLKVGNRTYAIACDTCKMVQDMGNLHFFSVTQEDIDYIHALFEKYGGFFPCI